MYPIFFKKFTENIEAVAYPGGFMRSGPHN